MARYKKFATRSDADAFIGGVDGPSTAGARVFTSKACVALARPRQPVTRPTSTARLSAPMSTAVPGPDAGNNNKNNEPTATTINPSSSHGQASTCDRVLKLDKRLELVYQRISEFEAKLVLLHKEKTLAEKEREVALLKHELESGAPSRQSATGSRRNAAHPYNNGTRPRTTQLLDIDQVRSLAMEGPTPGAQSATVYTDGACVNNGNHGAHAGIGVFWGPDDDRNVSEPLPGRQTNNRAEIHAIIRAVQQAKASRYSELNVYTDSQFVINSMTMWIDGWQRNNWKLSGGKPVVNREDFEELLSASEGLKINYTHVRGHQGIYGNECADQLATQGAAKRS